MLENQYVRLYLLQMQLLNNLQTEPYQLKSHDRSQTIDFCTNIKNDIQQIPIQQHFKMFLINQSQEMKRNPHSKKIKKFDRSVQHIKYLQQQQVSIQQFDNTGGGVNAHNESQKNKTERSYTKDEPRLLFNEFCQRIKRKKQSSKSQIKSQNTIQEQDGARQHVKQKEIKSFGYFLENIKGSSIKSETRSRRNQSLLETQTQKNNEQELKVRGNLKQLRQKCIKSKLKQRVSSKKSNKSASVDEKQLLSTETKTVVSKKVQDKSISSIENNKIQIPPVKKIEIKTSQVLQPSPKSVNRNVGYKNFYSPFNGIQIKYISSENQDIFQKLNASLDNKNQNLAITSFKKPFSRIAIKKTIVPNNIQKGIVFRYKQLHSKQLQQSIQGWKVEPYYDLNNDLFVQ